MLATVTVETHGSERVSISTAEDQTRTVHIRALEGNLHLTLSPERAKQLMLALAQSLGYGAGRTPQSEVHFTFE